MHNLRSYDKDEKSLKAIILKSDLTIVDDLKIGKNDELFNKLRQGARLGASMLAKISQEHNINMTDIFEKNKEIEKVDNSKKFKM